MRKRNISSNSLMKRALAIFMSVAMIFGGGLFSFPSSYADTSTEGTVNYSAQWTDSGSNVELSVTPQNSGTVYYLMQESGATAPSESSVQSNASANCAAGTTTTINISAGTSTAKDIYIIYQEDGSSSSYAMSKLTLPAYDSSMSTAGTVSITAERNGSDQLSLSVTPTVDGKLYYIVQDASAEAPSDSDFNSAASISESANTTKTTQISLGDSPTTAKKLYLRYYTTDNGSFVETAVMDIPALDSSSFSAEISSTELDLGDVLEGYSATDASATSTITNTGEGTLSFSVDTTADGYSDFSQYFNVDTSGTEDIASGEKGSVTVTPVEGLSAGTYSGTFYLVDQIDDNTLTLGPVTVTMTVAEKGTSTVEGVRSPEGSYTPSEQQDGALQEIIIDDNVAYCANYNYILYTNALTSYYENQYGVIRDVTNKELDAYTGLPSDGSLYPPNDNGFTPVKEGSDTSTVRDNVARVLYYGYPNDALNLLDGNNNGNYEFAALLYKREAFIFEVATQCAIWHYTDGIDFSNVKDFQQDDPRVTHVKQIYSSISSGFTWGWVDVQNLYNFLIGNDAELITTVVGTGGEFLNGVEYPLSESAEVPDDFAVDLFVVDNPVNVNNADSWTQNLVTASTASENTSTTDVSITKIWADQSDANSTRPDAETFKSWIHLYNGTTDVTDTYADYLTVTDNGNNTYTVTYSGLPVSGYTYTIQEVIPDEYSDSYKIPDGANSAENGGSLKNYSPTEETQNASLTVKKTDSDGNILDGAKFTLYSDEACTDAITDTDAIETSNGTVSISTDAAYLQNYLPTENNGTTTVYLKETTAPDGYELSDTVYPITLGTVIEEGWNSDYTEYTVTTSHTITYNNNVTLTVADQEEASTTEAYGKLTITKVSDTGDTLEGAVFTLYSEENNDDSALTTLTSGSDGTIVIDTADLPTGLENPASGTNKYYMKETSAPDGYTANSMVYEIVLGISTETTGSVTTTTHTITSYGSSSLRVVNSSSSTTQNAELTIIKTDADTGTALSGAAFALYTDANDDTTKIDGSDITTDSSGQAYINTGASYLTSYLPTEDGSTTLYLKETSAPTGYTASSTAYPITITRSTNTDTNVVTYTISSDSEDYSSDTVSLSVANTPITSTATVDSELTVYKVDETQQPLEGAEFTLYSDSGCTNVITKLSATDSNGNVTISTTDLTDYLPAAGSTSEVYLKETSAPDGYELNDTVYTLTLGSKATTAWNSDHTSKVTTTTYTITNASDSSDSVTVVDQPVVNLTVNKSWSSDLSSMTQAVTVRLTQNGTETDQELTLDESNQWTDTFENLPKYDTNGTQITYGVIEVDGSKNYDVTYTSSSNSITVTNSAKSIQTTVSVDENSSSSNQALTVNYSDLGDDNAGNVVDTVSYTGLDTSTTYTLVGRLMDVTDENNPDIVAQSSSQFTPTAADGNAAVDFGNVTLEIGHKYVVYEYLYNGVITDQSTNNENNELPPDETPITEHQDNDDNALTFVVVDIHTTVSVDDNESSSDQALTVDYSQLSDDDTASVSDTVSYSGLDTAQTYTVVGRLVDITDENSVDIIDQSSTTLTPTSADGSVEVDFGDVTLEAGHKYVVYEYLYSGEITDESTNDENKELPDETPLVEHHDNDDNAQAFAVTGIHTTVSVDSSASSSDEALSVDYSQLGDDHTASVVDTVTYTGLDTEETYTVVGRLMDITDEDNAEIIDQASSTLTPEAADGTVDVDFGDVTLEPGHTYVVYEYLYSGEITDESTNDENKELPDETPVAEHEDNDDNAQAFIVTEETPTPASPSISTTVSADGTASTSTKAVETSDTSVDVVDTVSYENLTSGTTYTLEGQLMDVTDSGTIVSVGSTETVTFTPDSANGTKDIDFGTQNLTPGHTYVVYETLYEGSSASGTPVAEHKDSTDKAQTVVVTEETPSSDTPSISTTVSADGVSSTSSKAVETSSTSVKVVDTVTYKNLTSGTTYYLQGQLMDVTSGETAVGSASATFTPDSANGTKDIDFGTQNLTPGHTYVVYETLYEGSSASGTSVAEHKDSTDKAQTIVVTGETPTTPSSTPSVQTTVSVDGTSSTSDQAVETSNTNVSVVDTVFYENLTAGTTYTLKGQLMDVTTGESVAATATMTFTPDTTNGSVNLDFGSVDVQAGHKYVVYEYLYEGDTAEGTPVAEHSDKNDTAQTFIVTSDASGGGSAVTTESTNSADSGDSDSTAAKPATVSSVKTGDNTTPFWLLALAGALIALFVSIRKRKSSNR